MEDPVFVASPMLAPLNVFNDIYPCALPDATYIAQLPCKSPFNPSPHTRGDHFHVIGTDLWDNVFF